MKRTWWFLLILSWTALTSASGGCGPVATIQRDLVTQGREGLRRVEAARKAESQAVASFLADRRRRLEAGFDADVRGQEKLTPEWVIEARQGYAVGLDLLAEQRARHAAADATAADNAAAADEALALLQRMLEEQSKILPFEFEGRE